MPDIYVAEVNMVIALWEQLNKDINNDLKQQILLMILESIINDDNSGLISQIAELTKFFLAKNRNYAILFSIFNGNEALIKKYAEKLSISFERVEYAKNNFIRVVKVMKAFILNNSVKSLLCLNNKLPQENKGLFDIKLLEKFADAIIKLYGIKGLKGKDLLYSINSEDYEAKRAEFIQRLSKGEKLFVISSYNTVGAGQNLQYKAPGKDHAYFHRIPR